MKDVSDRNNFKEATISSNASFVIYLYNIQKTPKEDEVLNGSINLQYKNNDVLFIIDEVHYAQSSSQANTRLNAFPNASFLSFTATPKITEKYGSLTNETAVRYSKETDNGKIYYLDELNATEAIEMGIILPVYYEKVVFEQISDLENAVAFDKKTKELIKKKLNTDEYRIKIEIEKEEAEERIVHSLSQKVKEGVVTEEVLLEQIISSKKSIDAKYLNEALKKVEKVEKTLAFEILRKEKIKFLVKDLKKKMKKCYSDKNKPNFRGKAFLVVDNQAEAEYYIDAVRELSGDNSNTINGVRFGADFSEGQQSTTERSKLIDLNEGDESIIRKFESQNEKENPVDVLIIVGKYLMGYDNKELVVVYCDTIIGEAAKLYQLITRSATSRDGKSQGFFVDLTFGEDNYLTYTNKCLPWYNNGSGTSISTLKKEEVIIQKSNMQFKLKEIRKVLGLDENFPLLDENDIYDRLLSKGTKLKDSNEVIKRKNNYFKLFQEINQIMKILIKPKYYMDNYQEILVLSKVNARYLSENCPKPDATGDLIFDRDLIKSIITESLSFFGISDMEEINSFKINSSKSKDPQQAGRIEFNNEITEFRTMLTLSRKQEPKGLADMIAKWSELILTESDAVVAINQFKKEIEEPFIQELEKEKTLIKEDFENDICWYRANEHILQSLNELDEKIGSDVLKQGESLYLPFIKFYSKLVSKEIHYFSTSKNYMEKDKSFYLEKLNKKSIKMQEADLFGCRNLVDDLTYKKMKRAFFNDSLNVKELYVPDSLIEYIKNASIGNIWILKTLDYYYDDLKNKILDS